MRDGSPAYVTGVEATGIIEPVYNFSVDGWKTYHVGELGVWVHNTCPDELIRMVQRAGHKISPQSVVGIRELPDGRIVWLENGNERSGLTHILGEYGDQFRQLGVADDRLPGFLLDTLERGKVLGFQGTGTGRPIYEGIIGEQRVRVSITVGENGYIVGANYAGRVRRP